jgi:hypothetical protein
VVKEEKENIKEEQDNNFVEYFKHKNKMKIIKRN